MAKIKNIQTSTYIDGYIEAWESDVNTTNNTSIVHAKVMLHRNNTWNGNTYSSSVWRKLTVNGVTVYDRTEAITVPPQANGYVCIAEGQTTVTHNSDGSKTVEVGFQSVDNVSAYFNCGWTSGTLSLATIPRTSSGRFDKTTYTIGDPIRINFTRGSASFTHEGYIQFPDRPGHVWGGEKYFSGADTSYTWTPTASEIAALYAGIPNAQSATMCADCRTKNGSTNIGDFSVGPATMVVNPNVCRPTFGGFTVEDSNSAVVAVTGNKSIMVQGLSKPKVTIPDANRAVAKYSATMKKYDISLGQVSKTLAYTSSGDQSIVLPEIVESTNQDLYVNAVDSRGLYTTSRTTITVIPYTAPVIDASIARAGGWESTTTLKIAGKISKEDRLPNTINTSSGVKYRYKKSSESTWSSWVNRPITITNNEFRATDLSLSLDNQSQWDVEIQVTDRLTTSTVKLVLPVGAPLLYVGKDGRLGVGTKPTISKLTGEKGLLEIAGRLIASGDVFSGGTAAKKRLARMEDLTSQDIDFTTLEKVLYSVDNPTGGTSGSAITLSDNIDNYDEVVVYYSIFYDYSQSTTRARVVKNGTTNVSCQGVYMDGTGGNVKMAQLRITGNKLSFFGQGEYSFATGNFATGNRIRVSRVIGVIKQGTI